MAGMEIPDAGDNERGVSVPGTVEKSGNDIPIPAISAGIGMFWRLSVGRFDVCLDQPLIYVYAFDDQPEQDDQFTPNK